jgi:hypothetical protein
MVHISVQVRKISQGTYKCDDIYIYTSIHLYMNIYIDIHTFYVHTYSMTWYIYIYLSICTWIYLHDNIISRCPDHHLLLAVPKTRHQL